MRRRGSLEGYGRVRGVPAVAGSFRRGSGGRTLASSACLASAPVSALKCPHDSTLLTDSNTRRQTSRRMSAAGAKVCMWLPDKGELEAIEEASEHDYLKAAG